MKRMSLNMIMVFFFLGFLFINSLNLAQLSNESEQAINDLEQESHAIDSLINLYAKHLMEGDSTSIAAMYATDGMIGCLEGPKILSAVGSWIRSLRKSDSRISFRTVTLNSDGELLIETGITETLSKKGEVKNSSRYLVVWKNEEGTWKLYRDIGL